MVLGAALGDQWKQARLPVQHSKLYDKREIRIRGTSTASKNLNRKSNTLKQNQKEMKQQKL
jgi:hypothetical protein